MSTPNCCFKSSYAGIGSQFHTVKFFNSKSQLMVDLGVRRLSDVAL